MSEGDGEWGDDTIDASASKPSDKSSMTPVLVRVNRITDQMGRRTCSDVMGETPHCAFMDRDMCCCALGRFVNSDIESEDLVYPPLPGCPVWADDAILIEGPAFR